MDLKEKLKDYFERYPASEEVFENGGVFFHTRGAAESFGKGETTRYTRKAALENANGNDFSIAVKFVRATDDVGAIKYEDMKKLVNQLGLQVENEKKETFVKALTAFKETLKDE
ncbi:MAG: hypothetical protein LBD53_01110 [Tannerella sp.]|jgi:hypothetical protein|nr:hypothetical protein [Tannerella sp.]